jgi:uncharacterized membrane protein YeaQ/YmgE (transglycosylase-associated protein family)
MDLTGLLIACVIFWSICGVMAAHVATHKRANNAGFLYGFLLGPFGVIAAGLLDKRLQCPNCGGRLNGEYPVCQHCTTKLDWSFGQPLTPEMIELLQQECEVGSTASTPFT